MVFRGDPRGMSPCQQSIEVVLEKIDCLLTAKGGGGNHTNMTDPYIGDKVNFIKTIKMSLTT